MSVQSKYTAMQAVYWMVYSVAFGFVTYYLLGTGIGEATIGMVTASGGIIAAILQPLTGSLTDSGRLRWKTILVFLASLCLLFNILMIFISSEVLNAVSYAGFITAVNLIVPVANGASFYYERSGEKINFGFARGTGSLFYGAAAYVLGAVSVRAGIMSVPAAGALTSLLLILILISMPCQREVCEVRRQAGGSIISRYPGFFMVVAGCTLCLSFHSISCNFLIRIVESCGGDAEVMGTAIAVSAVFELPAMFGFSVIAKRFSAGMLLKVSAVFFIIKSLLFLFSSGVGMIYFTQMFQAGSFALMIPASVYYAESSMEKGDKMKGQAYMGLALTAGSFIGALSGGFLIQMAGLKQALILGTAFTVAGFILIAAGTVNKKRESK